MVGDDEGLADGEVGSDEGGDEGGDKGGGGDGDCDGSWLKYSPMVTPWGEGSALYYARPCVGRLR